MKAPVIHVISEVIDSPSFLWLARRGKGEGWKLVFILMNGSISPLESQLREEGVEVIRLRYRGRKDFLWSMLRLFSIFRRLNPGAVHTHCLGANLAGLAAAWLARVPVRVYTRHHSNWNENGPFYASFYDHCANFFATKIVATCLNVKNYLTAREKVAPEKVQLVHLGFELSAFEDPSPSRIAAVKQKYDYESHWPVIGLVSRYIECKGVPYAIAAFSSLLKEYPDACLVLANAGPGAARAEIKAALNRLPDSSYREIAFESDCPALMRTFDAFVHVPVDEVSEAFGQVYVEALLNAVPSVTTLSGVAPEILSHGRNTILVPHRDSKAILAGLLRLISEPELGKQLSARGRADASEMFPMTKMIDGLRQIYL